MHQKSQRLYNPYCTRYPISGTDHDCYLPRQRQRFDEYLSSKLDPDMPNVTTIREIAYSFEMLVSEQRRVSMSAADMTW